MIPNPVFHWTPADDDGVEFGDGHVPASGWTPMIWQTNMGTSAPVTVTLKASGFGSTTQVIPLTVQDVH